MGLNLKLIPQQKVDSYESNTIIDLKQDYVLFKIIKEIEIKSGIPIPKTGIETWIGDNNDAYGTTKTTPFDDVIKGVFAKDLNKALESYKTKVWKNKAAIAFLKELPKNLQIWLYWE
jgi:intein-encoded DNA endonuclease-like protein